MTRDRRQRQPSQLIEDILDISRIIAGKLDVEPLTVIVPRRTGMAAMQTIARPQSVGEEIANAVTHGIGALLSVAALVVLVLVVTLLLFVRLWT